MLFRLFTNFHPFKDQHLFLFILQRKVEIPTQKNSVEPFKDIRLLNYDRCHLSGESGMIPVAASK